MAVLEQLYKAYRNDFMAWVSLKVGGMHRDDLLDAWHDTLIMFYEKVRDKKLTELTCDIKTFLFLIGYRRVLRVREKTAKIDFMEEFDANMYIAERINILFEEDIPSERELLLKDAMAQLPEQSREILIQRFIVGKTIPQIMEAMNYTSASAVSVTLSRTLKRLKESISERKSSIR